MSTPAKPSLFEFTRATIGKGGDVCSVTFDVSKALEAWMASNSFKPLSGWRESPGERVDYWCDKLKEFFHAQGFDDRQVKVVNTPMPANHSWYISCVGVPPAAMRPLGQFLDSDFRHAVFSVNPNKHAAAYEATDFASRLGRIAATAEKAQAEQGVIFGGTRALSVALGTAQTERPKLAFGEGSVIVLIDHKPAEQVPGYIAARALVG